MKLSNVSIIHLFNDLEIYANFCMYLDTFGCNISSHNQCWWSCRSKRSYWEGFGWSAYGQFGRVPNWWHDLWQGTLSFLSWTRRSKCSCLGKETLAKWYHPVCISGWDSIILEDKDEKLGSKVQSKNEWLFKNKVNVEHEYLQSSVSRCLSLSSSLSAYLSVKSLRFFCILTFIVILVLKRILDPCIQEFCYCNCLIIL